MVRGREERGIIIMIEKNPRITKKTNKKFGVSDFSATFAVPNGSIAQLV